jgi:hypothetical protein
MTGLPSNVVRIADYLPPPPPRRKRQKSQYELYPLPFFNAKIGVAGCTWDVKPSGNYGDDCKTGEAYAIEFLKSCDGTNGWASLLTAIVRDMIGAGSAGTWPDGGVRINGVVVGFMGTIGQVLCISAFSRVHS